MPKQFVRGGPWKNSEDEILKAAVMKYGKNQWARVSSLLNRKSAKQCKARWYEWLDPSIKKTEWTREEEEKLLHLAKIMPSQWKSIAPIVGRTASQCLEHYEQMLDEEQRKQEGGESSSASEDPRKLRVGEIDPNPETKAARPDPINMDEDELETLNEARARLANTKGKKAKRHLREKQLEEGRRIAALQKKRELKAAGLTVAPSAKKKRKLKNQSTTVDYNKEIPFYKKPAPGFYDTTDEDKKTTLLSFEGNSVKALEQIQNEQENEKKKKDKAQILLDKNLPEIIKRVDEMSETRVNLRKLKLSLPPPQITDEELDQIVKMGKKMNSLPSSSLSNNQATRQLMGDYKPNATPLIQPTRTPLKGDNTGEKLRELQQLSSTPTPIQLSRNKEGDIFVNPTPISTTTLQSSTVKSTPIIHQTPFRDQLQINTPSYASTELTDDLNFHKQSLKEGFCKLPTPTGGDFVVFKQLSNEEKSEFEKKSLEKDAGEKQKEKTKEKLIVKQSESIQRTSVSRRNYPKPHIPCQDMSVFIPPKEITGELDVNNKIASEMISLEMKQLLNNDISNEISQKKLGLTSSLMLRANIELAIELNQFNRNLPLRELVKFYQTPISTISKEEILDLLETPYGVLKQEKEKVEKSLSSFKTKQDLLLNYLKRISEEIKKSKSELENFKLIQFKERNVGPIRLAYLEEEVTLLSKKEKDLQEIYKTLLDEKDKLKIINLDNKMID